MVAIQRISRVQQESRQTSRRRLLDLFCGAGGAAIGYNRAGWEIMGVDNQFQNNYPYEFILGDAMEFLQGSAYAIRHLFDAIHASPPCQSYSSRTMHLAYPRPKLIEPLRELLDEIGLPYVIENVVGAPLYPEKSIMLCGTQFGKKIQRHRIFENNAQLQPVPFSCDHTDYVWHDRDGKEWLKEMELDWSHLQDDGVDTTFTVDEAQQAIPPFMTEYIGLQLNAMITASRATGEEGRKVA